MIETGFAALALVLAAVPALLFCAQPAQVSTPSSGTDSGTGFNPSGYDLARMNDASVVLHDRGAPQTLHNLSHLVGRIEHFLDHSGGDLKVLMQSMLPYLNDTSGALMNLDTAQIFGNMLAAVPEDGAVTLHVTIPDSSTPDTMPAGAPPASAIPGPSPTVGGR